jgi:hypothetical protein
LLNVSVEFKGQKSVSSFLMACMRPEQTLIGLAPSSCCVIPRMYSLGSDGSHPRFPAGLENKASTQPLPTQAACKSCGDDNLWQMPCSNEFARYRAVARATHPLSPAENLSSPLAVTAENGVARQRTSEKRCATMYVM